jgi:hypothetical protein
MIIFLKHVLAVVSVARSSFNDSLSQMLHGQAAAEASNGGANTASLRRFTHYTTPVNGLQALATIHYEYVASKHARAAGGLVVLISVHIIREGGGGASFGLGE